MAIIVIEGGPQNLTPPASATAFDDDGLLHPLHSASTTSSYYPRDQDWSPNSASTHLTTPPRSPHRIRDCGPLLLPRVRMQDQVLEPVMPAVGHYGHARTTSLPGTAFAGSQFGAHLQKPVALQASGKRSLSPGERAVRSPLTASPLHHMINDAASLARQSATGHQRSSSNARSHARSTSSSSIDASMLSRYGYPTYRQSPQPQPLSAGAAPTPAPRAVSGVGATVVARPSCAMSHLAPISMSNGQVPSYCAARSRSRSPPSTEPPRQVRQREPPPPTVRVAAPVQAHKPTSEDLRTSNALAYLTAPNPTPGLTRRTVDAIRGQHMHFWYDVRNVRVWTDFNVSTIAAVPDLLKLLQVPVSVQDLPTPSRVNLNPETASHLADLCASHHAVKVNAALRLTQGRDKHMSMRALRPAAAGARQQPEFISSYQTDVDRTVFGDARGRVVGIVKCYDQWNSGMRRGEAPDKVKYLHGLAQLHRFMREHGTRYGFVMTEIELVCVRAGGPPSAVSVSSVPLATLGAGIPGVAPAASAPNVPLFGFLEVARPVDISASGPGENGNLQMTAGLALWWLHMLAKEQPMPGQFHWRIDVGPPTARTRQYHLPRDEWMPKAIGMDTREAKRVRGWVWPHEPLSKRECGKGRKTRR